MAFMKYLNDSAWTFTSYACWCKWGDCNLAKYITTKIE